MGGANTFRVKVALVTGVEKDSLVVTFLCQFGLSDLRPDRDGSKENKLNFLQGVEFHESEWKPILPLRHHSELLCRGLPVPLIGGRGVPPHSDYCRALEMG